jgi:hypothetical protein
LVVALFVGSCRASTERGDSELVQSLALAIGPPLELEQAGDVKRPEERPGINPGNGLRVVGADGVLELPEVDGEHGGVEPEKSGLVQDGAVPKVTPYPVEDLSEAVGGVIGIAVRPERGNDAGAFGAIRSTRSREREERECSSTFSTGVSSFADGEGAERREADGLAKRICH